MKIIFFILCCYQHECGFKIDWTCVWTAIGAIATVFLAVIALIELEKSNKTQRASFIHGFKNDFFTEQTVLLITLFHNEFIYFVENNNIINKANVNHVYLYFMVNIDFINNLCFVLN